MFFFIIILKVIVHLFKFEVKRLSEEVAKLKNENTELMLQVEKTMTQHISIEKERDLLKKELDENTEKLKTSEMELDKVKEELKNLTESSKTTLEVFFFLYQRRCLGLEVQMRSYFASKIGSYKITQNSIVFPAVI